MSLLVLFCLAALLARRMENEKTRFKNDNDVMERFIVFEHRRSRKMAGKNPLY